MTPGNQDLADRVRALPGMDRLLPALDGLAPAFLVGGAVRDALRGESAVDLDVAIEGDSGGVARELVERLGGELVEHGRFGTAAVRAPGLSVDLAATRTESYPSPGALPDVSPAGIVDDLARRDFGVNAMAVPLAAEGIGHLIDPHGGAADLEAGRLRVLHEQSFIDDPTRILRGLRYETRLDLEFDPATEALAAAAVGGGAMSTISGDRLRVELLELLAERAPIRGLEHVRALGIDQALDPALSIDSGLVAASVLAARVVGADPALAGLAALVQPAAADLSGWVDSLGLAREAREAVVDAAASGAVVAAELKNRPRASRIYELLHGAPAETLAVAMALGAPADQVELYLGQIQETALEISGADLLAQGLPESPELGRALRETLHRKLDGELSGREQELRHALAVARGET